MPFAICKMCLKDKDLVSSHLMPRLLFDYCRKGEHRPVKVGHGVLIPTDRQTQAHILCAGCEDVLNKGGEAWISNKLATWERQFVLYELLAKVPPVFDEAGIVVYMAAQNPDFNVSKLMHFALGVFWKASIHSWRGDSTEPLLQLGPYSDRIRRWLLGESKEPPDGVHIQIFLECPQRAQITIGDPYQAERQGHSYRDYFFHVPGILLRMAVGKIVGMEVSSLALQAPGSPVIISEHITADFEKHMARTVLNARATFSYLKAKAKIDAERRSKG